MQLGLEATCLQGPTKALPPENNTTRHTAKVGLQNPSSPKRQEALSIMDILNHPPSGLCGPSHQLES